MSVNPDHVGGNFQWAKPPSCCDLLPAAIEDRKFIFVSNTVDLNGNSVVYMNPTEPDGSIASSKGIALNHCPFCGTKVQIRKKK